MLYNDSIMALATHSGAGVIAIILISGENATAFVFIMNNPLGVIQFIVF